MQTRNLIVAGAVEFSPDVFPDDRGLFVSPFEEREFAATIGLPSFPVVQASHSRSRRGVVRGIHFTRTPPGMATYVCCPNGTALDIVVDLRVGSPTFGRWDSVVLDQRSFRAVYLPVGTGHAFVALADDTVMSYLLSGGYVPANELAVSAMDSTMDLPIPVGAVLSARDRAAPTLAQAQHAGLLPDYARCLEITTRLATSHHGREA